jgi:hypothetical protein
MILEAAQWAASSFGWRVEVCYNPGMPDSQRAEVSKALEREVATLANVAASSLQEKWSAWLPPLAEDGTAGPGTATGSSGGAHGAYTAAELAEMMRNGYERLGPVVALSVLTDEPGLIADDMRWLARMFAARDMHLGGDDWAAVLLRTYADTCDSMLPEGLSGPVRDVIERAISILDGEAEV